MLQRCIRTKRPYLEQQLATWSFFRRHLNHERRTVSFVTNRNTLPVRLYETAAVVRKDMTTATVDPLSTHNSFQKICYSWSVSASRPKILGQIRGSSYLSSLFLDVTQLKAALDSLIQSSTPHLLLNGLDIAVQAGSTLKPSMYEFLCYRLAPGKRWDVILGVVEVASHASAHLTTRLLNWRARSLIELQEYRIAYGVLGEFEQAKQIPNQRTYHILISGCLRNTDMHRAKHLLQSMQQAGIPMTPELHSLIVQHYRDFGLNPDLLQATLDTLPSLDRPAAVGVLNSLIQMTLDSADYAATLQLLDYFNDTSVQRFRSLVLSLYPCDIPSSQARHSTMHHQRLVDPDSTTTSLFMNLLVANSGSKDAIQLGEDTLVTDVAPSEAFIASLINAYFIAGQDDDATMLLSRICCMTTASSFRQLKLDVDYYGRILGNIDHLSPSIKLFNAFLKGLCRRDADKLPVVFEIMEHKHIRPNSRTVEILLSFIKSKTVHPRILVHALKVLTSPSIPVNIRHLHHVLSAIASYDKHIKYGRGWDSFAAKFSSGPSKAMSRKALTQSPSSSPTAGITVQDQPSYRKLLQPFLQSLNERGMKSDAVMLFLRLRLDALDSDMDSAQSIFQTLLARGIRPNRYHYSAMIDGYARKGDFKSALLILRSAEKSGVTPTVEMYTSIIASYARRHDPVSASKTFQRMLDAEVQPDVAAIDALVSAYYAVGAYKIARLMLITLWKSIAVFPEDLRNANLAALIESFRTIDGKMGSGAALRKRDRIRIYHQIASLVVSYQRHFRT
ncbi:hypothetical protein BJ165DRAFT_1432263 [Panaeolus papilionaceus]|nr:hypothetical protein BJ165DRAFT_1432263 [Panaeolus papilionaceus]